MMKSLKYLTIIVLAIAALAVANKAKADDLVLLSLDFQSGANFTGDVDFSNGYGSVLSVSGALYGYTDPVTSAPFDTIDIMFLGNYATAPTYQNYWYDNGFLVPTPDWYYIAITYNDSSGLPVFSAANTYVGDYYGAIYDPLVAVEAFDEYNGYAPLGFSITPEPGTILLFGSGLVGLAGMMRRKLGLRA